MDEMMLEPEGRARLKAISVEHGNPDPFAGGMGGDTSETPAQHCGCTATVILIS